MKRKKLGSSLVKQKFDKRLTTYSNFKPKTESSKEVSTFLDGAGVLCVLAGLELDGFPFHVHTNV
jgi:hypothetical protein